jgi:hypothetical protein
VRRVDDAAAGFVRVVLRGPNEQSAAAREGKKTRIRFKRRPQEFRASPRRVFREGIIYGRVVLLDTSVQVHDAVRPVRVTRVFKFRPQIRLGRTRKLRGCGCFV